MLQDVTGPRARHCQRAQPHGVAHDAVRAGGEEGSADGALRYWLLHFNASLEAAMPAVLVAAAVELDHAVDVDVDGDLDVPVLVVHRPVGQVPAY